ncbi:MAG: M81 family metallopeptidase [Alphaproteobacteria bacterium]|nr:M81 family metallopeptidase [Alphaproteobacteria bacterium]
MKFAIGALLFEGNTFSPVVTQRRDFASKYLHEGEAMFPALADTRTEIAGGLAAGQKGGATLVPLLATHGGAGGRVAASCLAELRAGLLGRLRAAGPIDGLYLALHGAFVAEGSDDVEGELLRDVRAIVGDVPVVVSCDLHAHVTTAMLAHCDALVAYQLYPHDDAFETGERAMRLLLRLAAGERLAMRACRAPLLLPAQRQRTKGDGPMARMFAQARALETGGVHAISYFPVQPWMDLPEMGFTTVVVADSAAAADMVAEQITRAAWDAREEFQPVVLAPAEAIAAGLAVDGLVVLADAADCVGGGATGDSAHAIHWLRRCAPAATAAVHVVDPETVAQARVHRIGARFQVALGNKQDPAYGAPVTLDAELVAVSDGAFRYAGGLMGGVAASTGPTVVLRCGPIEIVVASLSSYEYSDEVFAANGVDARGKKFVVVKNPMNYQAAYPEATAHFIMDTPGPTTPKLAGLPWHRLDRPTYPLDPACPGHFVRF